jgi:NAD(P)-dependent dehydrogenase (short-subunit alcohol dehydrogenase family)
MSAANHPVILIFGAGANTGYGVANAFSRKGYKVAIVSRGALAPVFEGRDFLHVKGDLADTSSVEAAYKRTVDELGIPSVVIHNGE